MYLTRYTAPTYRVCIEESAGSSDQPLEHGVVEVHGRLHAQDEEVCGPDHGGDDQPSYNSGVDTQVKVVVVWYSHLFQFRSHIPGMKEVKTIIYQIRNCRLTRVGRMLQKQAPGGVGTVSVSPPAPWWTSS